MISPRVIRRAAVATLSSAAGAGFAHALDPLQCPRSRAEHASETAELRNQRLGHGFGVALLDRGEQQVFEHFVIGQRLGPASQQARAQAGAMASPGGLACPRDRLWPVTKLESGLQLPAMRPPAGIDPALSLPLGSDARKGEE